VKKILPDHAIVIPDHAKRVFQGIIFDVYHWEQKMYDGSLATFEMLKRPDTMQIIGIKDGQLVMVNDEQPNRTAQLHFPGGRADHQDETWLQAAQREMREETGLSFKNWRLIAVYQPLGKIEQFAVWYLATDVIGEEPQQLDAGEKIVVHPMEFEDVKALIFDTEHSAMSYAIPLFTQYPTLNELLAAPEFKGREADR
jgi:8-oxo-dGTP pyrophosphatase MutT (NUDIX family)